MSLRTVISLCLLALLAGAVPARADDVSIIRVYSGWRDASSFKRIAEYFDGKEHNGGEAIVRSHPEARQGFYFFVRTRNPGELRQVRARLQVITAANSQAETHEFPLQLRAKDDTVFHLGLTGPDWPDAKLHPVAWKLELTDPDGRVLATEVSYLWEKPAKL